MRIKAKIAYNYHTGTLPRGTVIDVRKDEGETLIKSGKFVATDEAVTKPAQEVAPVATATAVTTTPPAKA